MHPNLSFDYIKLPKDAEGFHFGLFENEELVSVGSLFIENNKAQFRKLATLESEQGKGFGSKLLNHIFEFANTHNVESIWCNARANKTAFYKKFEMYTTEKTYTQVGIDFVVMERLA